MDDIRQGNMVKIVAGPAAGKTGIVTLISKNRAQVTSLFYGTSYCIYLTDLKKIGPEQNRDLY